MKRQLLIAKLMAAVTILTLLFTGISSYAVGVGEVRGGFSTTVTFDDLSDNNISAYPAAGWSFQTANASPSSYKGASCSVFGAGTYTKMGTFNFVNFTVQLWGRITASGSGPGPDTYSITANRQLTVYYIETDKTIIPKGDTQPFYAKEAMLTGPIGPKNSDWTITPAGGGSAITAQGTSWTSASDMAAGSYTVSASPTIFAEATSDSKNLKIVEVASVSATYNGTTKTSDTASPGADQTLYVLKGSSAITVTATPNPSGFPTGYPTWTVNGVTAGTAGSPTYSFNPATADNYTIAAYCGSSYSKALIIKVINAELKSVGFSGDHNSLLNNNTDWTSGGNRFTKPEYDKTVSPVRNSPVSYTKGTNITLSVTVKVEPAGILYNLTGSNSNGYFSFSQNNITSTGGDQSISIQAGAALPNQIGIINQSIAWKVNINNNEISLDSSGSHKIYVTYGTPTGSAVTEKRLAWCVQTCSGLSTPSSMANAIYGALASDPPKFQLTNPNVPLTLWLLMASSNYQGQCIHLASLMILQMSMLGYSDSSIGYVYGSSDTDCFSTSDSAQEQRTCNVHGTENIYVGAGNQWSNWEAVCRVGNVNYAIKIASGTAIEVLRTWLGSNAIDGEHQAWLYYDTELSKYLECSNPGPCPVPKP